MHFAKDVRFANTPGNDLGDLGDEVKDEDLLMHEIHRE
jgi:hypothetical protein